MGSSSSSSDDDDCGGGGVSKYGAIQVYTHSIITEKQSLYNMWQSYVTYSEHSVIIRLYLQLTFLFFYFIKIPLLTLLPIFIIWQQLSPPFQMSSQNHPPPPTSDWLSWSINWAKRSTTLELFPSEGWNFAQGPWGATTVWGGSKIGNFWNKKKTSKTNSVGWQHTRVENNKTNKAQASRFSKENPNLRLLNGRLSLNGLLHRLLVICGNDWGDTLNARIHSVEWYAWRWPDIIY